MSDDSKRDLELSIVNRIGDRAYKAIEALDFSSLSSTELLNVLKWSLEARRDLRDREHKQSDITVQVIGVDSPDIWENHPSSQDPEFRRLHNLPTL